MFLVATEEYLTRTFTDEQRTVAIFAEQCARHLGSIFANPEIDLREGQHDGDPTTSPSNIVFKLGLVRTLWSALVGILPANAQSSAAKHILRFLVEERDDFVQRYGDEASDKDEEALSEWAQLIAQVAAVTHCDFTSQFWSLEFNWDDRSRARAWRAYVRGWTEDGRGSWEGATVLLGRPFR